MASVRLTQDLRNIIHRNACDAYKNVNIAPKATNKQCEFIAKAVKNTPIQQLLADVVTEREKRGEMYAELGENLMEEKYNNSFPQLHKTSVIIITNNIRNNQVIQQRILQGDVRFILNTPIQLYSLDSYPSHRTSNKTPWSHASWMVSEFALNQQTEVAEIVDKLLCDGEEFYTNQKSYETQIKEVLKQCTTVKQLLEVWPASESLIPPEKLQQMSVKITRKQRAENIKEEIQFDASKLNKHLLANKLLGAAK